MSVKVQSPRPRYRRIARDVRFHQRGEPLITVLPRAGARRGAASVHRCPWRIRAVIAIQRDAPQGVRV